MYQFANRREAGRLLARQLQSYANRSDVLILALPRGGVPVGYEVAVALHAPLDVFIVRKIGAPWNEELAIGAVASGGAWRLDQSIIYELGISQHDIERIVERESREVQRRERVYRGNIPFPNLDGRIVILVDDGLATGSSMLVAAEAIRRQSPNQLIVAAPVASESAAEAVRRIADDCVVLMMPEPLYGIGMYYEDFSQTTDDEVLTLLQRSAQEQHQI